MATTLRQNIEAIIAPKSNPNGDGARSKNQLLAQYHVNNFELSLIRTELINDGGTFVEEFFNKETESWLVWNSKAQQFIEKTTGEPFFISLFVDDFSDLVQSALDWTFANGTGVNDWVFGSANPAPAGVNSMYISNDVGVTNAYSGGVPNVGVSHASVDVVIPAGQSVRVKVQMLCNGEPLFDDLRVFAYNVATVPVADVLQNIASQKLQLSGSGAFIEYEFDLPSSFTGTTMTLSFQWQNDASVQNDPPANVAKVEVLYK